MSATDIEEALKTARYNEAVVVTVPASQDEDGNEVSPSRELVLVATLDEENGGITWKDVLAEGATSSNNDDGGSTSVAQDIALQRHLRTKRWFLPMLNDHRRNEMYEKAIAKAARKAAASVVNGKRQVLKVLDIGTGTGLLAMMAAKHCRAALDEHPDGSEVKIQVTSIEMAGAMARLGRQTIVENGMENIITVVEGHSSDPNFDMKHEIDFCTSELLESGLLGEGVVPALRDAWERHLRPDAAVVPVGARVFAQVLEGKDTVACYRGPSVPDPCPEGNERLCITADRRDVLLGGTGRGGIRHPIRGEALFEKLSSDSPLCEYELAKKLSNPAKVLEFDFSNPNSFPMKAGRSMTHSIESIASGTTHGVLFWWDLDMEEDLTYSTEPKSEFQDHWQQCLWVFGQDDDQCPRVTEGESFNLVASHDDYGISFYIGEEGKNGPESQDDDVEPPPAKQQKVEQTNGSMNRYISPDRAMQLNNVKTMDIFRDAVVSAISAKRESKTTTMLHLGDFSLGAIIAGVNADRTDNCLQISSLESSSGNLPITAATVAQIGNGLPRGDSIFQILQAHAENLTLPVVDPVGKGSLDIVCAEPYYEMLEGWHIQEALNLFYTIRMLRGKRTIQPDTCLLPVEARIMGCAVYIRDLGQAYTQCVHSLGGFKHETAMENAARYHTFSASFSLWQYRHQLMSKPFEVARISYQETDKIQGNGEWKSGILTQTGICHGIVYWVDYVIRTDSDSKKIMSTFSRRHKQLVRFCRPGAIISDEDIRAGIQLKCKMTFGGLGICEDHNVELTFTS